MFSKKKEHKQIEQTKIEIKHLPSFNYEILKPNQLETNGLKFIIFFDPDCEACQNLARIMLLEKEKFNNLNVTMLSIADKSQTELFIKRFNLSVLSTVAIGCDTDKAFKILFKTSVLPSIFIYNKKNDLIDVIQGETTLKRLLRNTYEKN